MPDDRRVPPRRNSRRSHAGLVLVGAFIVLGGFAVGVVESLRLPRGPVWIILVIAAVAVAIRAVTRTR